MEGNQFQPRYKSIPAKTKTIAQPFHHNPSSDVLISVLIDLRRDELLLLFFIAQTSGFRVLHDKVKTRDEGRNKDVNYQ